MEEIKKALILPKLEYYEAHLSIINCILPVKLTPVPLKVLATFMALEGDIEIDRFGSSARSLVKEALNLSSAGLSNHMKFLLINEFIYYTPQGRVKILPLLIPEPDQQDYRFKLINNGETNSVLQNPIKPPPDWEHARYSVDSNGEDTVTFGEPTSRLSHPSTSSPTPTTNHIPEGVL